MIEMADDFSADLITLTDEDGNELEFEILDEIDTDDGHFFALLPTFETENDEDGGYYILKEEEIDGEMELAEVEDEDMLDSLAAIFEQHFEELYNEDDSEEE